MTHRSSSNYDSQLDRFFEKINKKGNNGCWLWVGSRRLGYGRFYDGRLKALVSAHRMSWEIHFGNRPPNDIKVLHRCDNPSCVNPAHLFLGTQQDNIDDMCAKGRQVAPKGSSHHKAKLSEKDVIQIRALRATKGIPTRLLARKFSISVSSIKHILHGDTWRSVV